MPADKVTARHMSDPASWQVLGVPGSKGQRQYQYAWAWIATTSDRHFLLIRRHLATGELAYHYCYIPDGRPVVLATLVQVACLRWPVEEDFEFGKDSFGLDHSQVRLYTALTRHMLCMGAIAVCAVTAAQAKTASPPPVLPTTADDPPPPDAGLIAFTVTELKRLFLLLNRRIHHITTTCTGATGDDDTKPAPDGSTTAPDYDEKSQHDRSAKVRLPKLHGLAASAPRLKCSDGWLC